MAKIDPLGRMRVNELILKVPARASFGFFGRNVLSKRVSATMVWKHLTNAILRFEAPDNTQMALVPLREFENAEDYFPAEHSEIPVEHAILGIDAIQLRVQYAAATKQRF